MQNYRGKNFFTIGKNSHANYHRKKIFENFFFQRFTIGPYGNFAWDFLP